MSTPVKRGYFNEWHSHDGHSGPATKAAGSDPTIISLTRVEFSRLIGIEQAAKAALDQMSAAHVERKSFIDAAEALDTALHSPVFGG
jgi:hypothetical protein